MMKRGRIIVCILAAVWGVSLFAGLGLRSRTKTNQELLTAAYRGDVAGIRALLARGADVNVRNREGHTPLWEAAYAGRAEAARLLLDRGADANARDENGMTPLMWAVCGGYADTVRVLLERGADVNARSRFGLTAMSCVKGQSRREVADLLKKAGARP
jgi:ankyrin repeat protein